MTRPFARTARVMARGVLVALALAAVFRPGPAPAVLPDEMLSDPKLEHRAREISKGLRCLVCQNQSIDDSNASLAKDLRVIVRERLKAGDSDAQVVNFVVDRYGEFVLLKPRFEGRTLVLWLGPPFIIACGLVALFVFYRRRRGPSAVVVPAQPLSEDEKKRLARLLDDDGTGGDAT